MGVPEVSDEADLGVPEVSDEEDYMFPQTGPQTLILHQFGLHPGTPFIGVF